MCCAVALEPDLLLLLVSHAMHLCMPERTCQPVTACSIGSAWMHGLTLHCLYLLHRATLVSDMSTNKALLKKLEDTLLRELSNATGNILDNQELIATLESAKEKAVDISTKLTAAKATAKDIEEARVRYTPVATRGAVLFFVMASLNAVNNMYEYSLAAFLKVFKQVRDIDLSAIAAAFFAALHQQ